MDAVQTQERDRTLIAACLQGHGDAFGALVAPYQDRLYNTLYRLTGREEDAAELLQETMIRAFRGLASYQGESSFYTWLYRIAMNVAFTHQRRRRMRSLGAESVSPPYDVADESEHSRPGRHLERAEQRDIIQRALDQLDEPFRAVLILKDIEDLRYEEIAEILDIPVGTVRSRLHRARAEMRELLRPYLEAGTL